MLGSKVVIKLCIFQGGLLNKNHQNTDNIIYLYDNILIPPHRKIYSIHVYTDVVTFPYMIIILDNVWAKTAIKLLCKL